LLNQSFTGKSFLKLTSLRDVIRFKLGREKSDYLERLDVAAKNIVEGKCDFSDISFYVMRGKKIFKPNSLESVYGLRRVNKILGRIYKVKQSDRDGITRQLNALIADTSPYVVIRGDIKSFYESVSRLSVLDKIESNRILSYQNRSLIRKIFASEKISVVDGLPRGISISSSLSELYIREFDRYVRGLNGVYYYARYVDDFVVFCHEGSDEALLNIDLKLKGMGLLLNEAKTRKIKSEFIFKNSDGLGFLGYEHYIDSTGTGKVRISRNRVRKIKTRIVLSFLDFARNKNLDLLCLRLKFVTGNYLIREGSGDEAKGLMAGFYYNNKTLTDVGQIRDLDGFLMRLSRSKRGSVFRAVGASHMRLASIAVQGISFDKGFNQRQVYKITKNEFSLIKECWRREEYYEKKY
jgi:hypothetical protein